MKYTYKLTEEIARWAFEIKCKESADWYISFTNPTAGPWKSMKGLDENGKEGEIYRFGADEERPDIVLINDKLKMVIIIEAKDSLPKLVSGEQAEKSVNVVSDISNMLKHCSSPFFGKERQSYPVYLGLLWGSETFDDKSVVENVQKTYYDLMQNYDGIDKSAIINISTLKRGENLECLLFVKNYNLENAFTFEKQMAESFGVRTLDLQ